MRAPALGALFVLLVVGFWLGGVVVHMTPEPTTGYPRDLYAYFFPRLVYGAQAVWSGRIPLWNPYELCGAPFLASAQSGVLNPIAALVFGLAPPTVALHVFFVVHYLLAGVAMYLFCRAADLGWQSAALASVGWTFSPALTRAIYQPNRIACLVWLPAIFLCAERLRREPRLSRAALLALTGAQLGPTVELIGESARGELTARPVLAPGPSVLGTAFGLRRDVGFAYLGMLPAFYVGALPLALAAAGSLVGRSHLRAPFTACALLCVLGVVGYRYLHLLPIY